MEPCQESCYAMRVIRTKLSIWLLGLVVLSGCMGTMPPQRIATLKVRAVPPNTQVYINGRYAGRAALLQKVGKALRPGVQYVTFSAPGYFPHDVRVDLAPGETEIDIKLRPIPQ